MKRTYIIAEHVWGELSTNAGPFAFDYEAGDHVATHPGEELVLEYLVSVGRASLASETKKKKEA